MSILLQILASMGWVTAGQLKELVKHYPKLPLIIKWSSAPRERIAADAVAERIAAGEAAGDHCREVFIEAQLFRKLKELPPEMVDAMARRVSCVTVAAETPEPKPRFIYSEEGAS